MGTGPEQNGELYRKAETVLPYTMQARALRQREVAQTYLSNQVKVEVSGGMLPSENGNYPVPGFETLVPKAATQRKALLDSKS